MQLSLFDEQDLAEITAPELYPGERLVVCRNPLLAAKRARKRLDLLAATEGELDKVVAATRREQRPLRGKDMIAVRADRALRRYKVGKHFDTESTDDSFSYARNEGRIAEEAALDGIYVIRTNVPAGELPAEEAVRSYKGLSRIERAFRSYKTVDLKVRPVHHRLEGRVRAHVFLCMLAYYVEWHMRRALAPLLFDDDDPAARGSPVLTRCTRPALARSPGQGGQETHPGRPPRPQLPHAPGRPRHPDPQPGSARSRGPWPPTSSPVPPPFRPKPSASSAFAHEPYPVAYTPDHAYVTALQSVGRFWAAEVRSNGQRLTGTSRT